MSGTLTAVQIDFTDLAMEDFLRLPWAINARDPYWVPPLLSHQRAFLNPAKGPFFEFGEAVYFLARRDGRAVGRISAHINRLHDEHYKDATGFFGFFECIDDEDVAKILFDQAFAWLRRRGKKRVLGPLSFGIYDEVGVLIDGFETLPAVMHVHNPPYYERLLRSQGFEKAIDWYAYGVFDLHARNGLEDKLEAMLAKHDLVLKRPSPDQMVSRAEEVRQIFNETWEGNWGHVPFTEKQFAGIMKELKPVLKPEFTRFVADKNDNIVAFMITVPDVNPILKKANGELGPFVLAELLYNMKCVTPSKLRILIMGVKREHQRKRLHHAMIHSTYIHVADLPSMVQADCSLIVETNTPLLRALTTYNARRYKTWRLFERPLPCAS